MDATTASKDMRCEQCRTVFLYPHGGQSHSTYINGQGPFCKSCVNNGVSVITKWTVFEKIREAAGDVCDGKKQLLPCPFCGDDAVEVICPWNSSEIAITCPSNNCLVFGRQGIGDRRLIYGPRWAASHWWNTRANKTQ